MLRLILLRHAEAESSEATDFDRPLSSRGREQALLMRDKFKTLESQWHPHQIFISKASRAKQTWELIKDPAWVSQSCLTSFQPDLYLASVAVLQSLLKSQGSKGSKPVTMLIGHNPGLAQLITYLTEEYIGVEPAMATFLSAPQDSLENALFPGGWQLDHIIQANR